MVVVSNGIRFELGDVRSKRRIRENVKLLNDGMGGGDGECKDERERDGLEEKEDKGKIIILELLVRIKM